MKLAGWLISKNVGVSNVESNTLTIPGDTKGGINSAGLFNEKPKSVL